VRKKQPDKTVQKKPKQEGGGKSFHFEFLNQDQKLAWGAYQKHEILFLIGPAGTAKSFLATAFAIKEIVEKTKKNIVLTRPIVEAGEKLGFLPGDLNEKVDPYMMPLYDSIDKLTNGELRDHVNSCLKISPLAYMRGSTYDNSVCIFDEAQNATYKQLVLFLTRLGNNSKMIITGDPEQIDLPGSGLMDMVEDLQSITKIGIIEFKDSAIVRNPLVTEILKKVRKRNNN
jgi:phosphate starvation-inducible PhoH-like protein